MTQSIINIANFNLDKMFDSIYPLDVVNKIFKKLDKNWKSLNDKDSQLLVDIHDFLESNYYKCEICDNFFEDHHFVDENRPECWDCFSEKYNY